MKRYLKSIYKAMGANAYLKHSVTVAEVADSIRQVRSGIAQCSPDVTAMLFERVASLSSAAKINDYQNHPFTRREFEVLNLIAKGYSEYAAIRAA